MNMGWGTDITAKKNNLFRDTKLEDGKKKNFILPVDFTHGKTCFDTLC